MSGKNKAAKNVFHNEAKQAKNKYERKISDENKSIVDAMRNLRGSVYERAQRFRPN